MIKEIYNYLSLTESIATAGQPTERQIAAIAENGYEVVINIASLSKFGRLQKP